MKKICDRLYYVGVNDRVTALFEALWPIPKGVSYNSYLVEGDSAIALIDGTEASQLNELRHNIEAMLGRKAPDYLVINHMEPDHSGAIAALMDAFPSLQIIGNAKTLDMAKGFYGLDPARMTAIKEGDTLDLGGVELKFYLTPMIHWPETMMTYCPQLQALFSGDAFGCFGALNGAVVDRDMDVDWYYPEMDRYYACIVGKYGLFVQKALQKLKNIEIKRICTTHGPVWEQEMDKVISKYDKLSRFEAEDGVTIVYGSMYGNTARMAEKIASALSARGIRKIRMHNLATSNLSYVLADVFRYKGLVIGAPTYNNSLFPPVETFVQALKNREVKNRTIAVFGSYTWGPQAVKRINALLDEAKILDTEMPTVENRYAPTAVDDAIDALVDALLQKLK